ncbi:nitroreductase [Allosaccharopolyspora coralli]|uniref:Nitroreductase n=1 Tax=Allosaccharopolyspora coralli TaxID=2665642 RepID=A0A5Q3QC34_9PSEU|nr:nitroreductase family protein [Allosaccharopolyspora coralli]QGK68357.1 nitroreductase [Allosaccharopolyspora coralli]
MSSSIETGRAAETSVPLHPILAQRWSPRAFDATAEVTDAQLAALFEAARWAPSWGNSQPARYVLGRRGDATFELIRSTLSRGNSWAGSASALVIGVAKSVGDEGDPLPYHAYSLGLATQNLVLQAVDEGLVTHQMAGFDADRARELLGIPDGFDPWVAIAVGTLGEVADLPESLQRKENAPRNRHDLAELVFTGDWQNPVFPGDSRN